MTKINNPIISVIMPVYNSERYLKNAIESILEQTYKDFEFIIVDDGSEDSSKKIIKGYIDERIRFFESEHLGYVRQLNFAIRNSRGKFIARMDSDDIAVRHRFEKQLQYLTKHPKVKLVGSDIAIINENEEELYIKEYPKTLKDIEFQMPIYSSFCHPCVMMEKETILSLGGYDEKFEPAEDHILFLQMLVKGIEMCNLPEILLKYRIHNNSVTSNLTKVQNEISYSFGKKYLKNKWRIANSNLDKFRVLFRFGLIEYYRSEMKHARKYFINALIYKPQNIILVSRYILVTFLGTQLVKYLREKNILSKINLLIINLFKYDTHKIKSK